MEMPIEMIRTLWGAAGLLALSSCATTQETVMSISPWNFRARADGLAAKFHGWRSRRSRAV